VSKPTTRRTHHTGERKLLFMIPGQTILDLSDEDIARLVDETFPEAPAQSPVRTSKRPRAVGKPLRTAKGP
jgi:hypothetical protein